MVNYNYSKIYKITNTINDEIYIGSTTYQYLCSRMNSHRMMVKDNTGRRKSKLYNLMRELGVENFKIFLIEECKCNNKDELLDREQYYIKLLNPSLNMINCVKKNNDEMREYKKLWYRNKQLKEGKVVIPNGSKTKEQIANERKEYKRQWYLNNKKHK